MTTTSLDRDSDPVSDSEPEREPDFDTKDPAFWADPYPVFARFRNAAPVHRAPKPFDGWFLFRYADVLQVCKDGVTFSADVDGDGAQCGMFQLDDPAHGLVRQRIATAWFEAASDAAARVDQSIKRTLDQIEKKASGGKASDGKAYDGKSSDGKAFDLVDDFARPVPRDVYFDILGGAGIDAQTRRDLDTLARTVMKHHDHTFDETQQLPGTAAGKALGAQLMALLAQARHGTAFEGSFLQRLAPHVGDAPGNPLSTMVAVRSLVSMTVAGYMSVEFLLATCVRRLLLDDARWWQGVQKDPGLLSACLDEARRCEHALSVVDRIATRDVEVGNKLIAKGDRVYGVLASANRDEAVYGKDADEFNPGRHLSQPHLGFGHGVHECMGIHLQKLIAEPAIRALMTAWPGLRLAPNAQPSWFENFYFRSFDHLQVVEAVEVVMT
ncbi:cytochrome P450 [Roseateles noduli]|uniref:cytochrome P450 n=1 Tax=Roseateles noduli TaxID=2052484 RepID=UPI003D6472F4